MTRGLPSAQPGGGVAVRGYMSVPELSYGGKHAPVVGTRLLALTMRSCWSAVQEFDHLFLLDGRFRAPKRTSGAQR
jgi:hypothetical protein